MSESPLRFGDLLIDLNSRRVTVAGEEVHLTKSEYGLLEALVSHPGWAVSSRDLLEHMWGSDWLADTTVLHVHASRLRKKLGESGMEPQHIQTVHGYGYRFDPDAAGQRGTTNADEPRALVNDMAVMTVAVGLDRVVQWASPETRDVLGFDPAALIGTVLYDLVHPEDRQMAMAARADLDAGHVAALHHRMTRVDGNHQLVDAFIWPIKDGDGTPVSFIGRISKHIGIADSMKSRDVYDVMVELVLDRDFILREIRPDRPFLGWDPADILDRFFSPTGADEDMLRGIVDALLGQGRHEVEGAITVRNAAGDSRIVPMHSRIAVDAAGHFAGMTTILRGV